MVKKSYDKKQIKAKLIVAFFLFMHIIHQEEIMFNLESLKLFLVISIAISSITCTIIQKTKALFKSSKTII